MSNPRSNPVPAVGVFQEPDTVHLLHLDPREAIAHLASIIIGQNDQLLAEVKALREEVRALRPAPDPAAEEPATETAEPQLEPEVPAAEAPAAPVSKRRSFADNQAMQEAARASTAAARELDELRKALATCKGQREFSKLVKRIAAADKSRAEWRRVYRQLRDATIAANP